MSVNYYDKTTGQLIPISGNDVSKPAYFDTKAEAEQALASISEGSLICTGDEWDTSTYDNVPTSGSQNIVKSGGVFNALAGKSDLSNLGTVETATATYPHSVGECFVDANGQFVKCTAAIAVGDAIAVGTNVSITGVSQALSELNSNITIIDHVVVPATSTMPALTFVKFSNGIKRLKITSPSVVSTAVQYDNVVPSGYSPYDDDARGYATSWNDVGTREVLIGASSINIFPSTDNSTGLVCRMNYI